MALVVDLSNNNYGISFTALRAAGVKGVICKATEGLTFDDPSFSRNRKLAQAVGIHFGAYHFARPDNNGGIEEARHFCQVVKSVGKQDIKPVLDYERDNKLTPAEQAAWIHAFNGEVKKRLGLYPMFYSYPYFIDRLELAKPVGNGLWLASYGVNDGKPHPYVVPKPWKKAALHQYTSNGIVKGVNGKLDLSSGSLWSILAHPLLGQV